MKKETDNSVKDQTPHCSKHVVSKSALIQQKMTVKEKALYLIEKFDVKYYYKFTKGQLPEQCKHKTNINQTIV
jgi:hypothetical protein